MNSAPAGIPSFYQDPADSEGVDKSVLISIIVPAFNERAFIEEVLQRLVRLKWPEGVHAEILVIDDGSTDGTAALVWEFASEYPNVRLEQHRGYPGNQGNRENRGKGAAIQTGLHCAAGGYIAFQDADLEIRPEELPYLLAPLLAGEADVVFGTRFGQQRSRDTPRWRYLGNRLATWLSNSLNGLDLTDVTCGQRVMTRAVVENLNLHEQRFGIEAEIVAKVARGDWRVRELLVAYAPRTHSQGKKIRLGDGFSILLSVLRHNLKR